MLQKGEILVMGVGLLARAIRYLAENDYLTGETIDVNGAFSSSGVI
jgi:hypothetical protein